MNRSHLWKSLFVLFTIVWATTEILPYKARNLIDQFDKTAVLNPDATLNEIINQARALDANNRAGIDATTLTYSNLLTAIGSNDIRKYFPSNYVLPGSSSLPIKQAILNRVQRESAGQFNLGIDLKGGTSFLLELDLSRLSATNRTGTNSLAGTTNAPVEESFLNRRGSSFLVEQAISVLRKRVDALGVSEPVIQPAGEKSILVQLPGLTEASKEEARANLRRAAFLEFRMTHPRSDELLSRGVIPPGYERKMIVRKDKKSGQEYQNPIIIKREAEQGLTGEYVSKTDVLLNPMTGQPNIHFNLNSEGAKIFAQVTTRNVGQRLAILLDGEVLSAPTINSAITAGSGEITGDFDLKEANDLASALDNPLKTPLRIIDERGVDPSVGVDSVRSGVRAAIISVIAVAVFMLAYYLVAGVVANIALLLNILLLLGIMCSLDVTYTLPGIAGIVLTIGMAVDANVLIYERMREELHAGKSVRGAIAAGYDKAFGTIFDSNLTTLISSVLLILLGTGTVKGFGIALSIGIAVSMFTALVVTRMVFDAWLAMGERKSLPMMNLIKSSKVDFIKVAKPAFILSWAVILVGIGYGIFVRGHNMQGVEFAGGDSLVLSFDSNSKIDTGAIRKTLEDLKMGESGVQYQTDPGTGKQFLNLITPHSDEATIKGLPSNGARAEELLQKTYPQAKFVRVGLDLVGPSVGFEVQKSAIIASLLSLFGILLYVAFRYEFSFAVGAVLAVIHDVLMTIGIYCLTGLFHEGHLGRQFNATFVAALLTIIGFSINDTIVIFDRIREDLKLGKRGTFREIINTALNETLSRTVITSGTVFISTVILYLFGGGAINDFAFTFLAGIITGTYSSIYIASALVLWWHKGERPNIGAAVPTMPVAGAIEIQGKTI